MPRTVHFKITKHVVRDAEVVEVYDQDNHIVAVIYPLQDGMRVISAHIGTFGTEGHDSPIGPQTVRFDFKWRGKAADKS